MAEESGQGPCPMTAEPQRQHQWLERLVGDWVCEGEAVMQSGEAPVAFKATESVRSLGGLWTVAEGRGDMPGGGSMTSITTLGYDPGKGRYVGTFVASMMTHLWLYEGALDVSGTVLTLDTEGPNFATEGKTTAKFQDVVEFKSDDHRTLTSRMLGDDGQWRQVMSAQYRRKA